MYYIIFISTILHYHLLCVHVILTIDIPSKRYMYVGHDLQTLILTIIWLYTIYKRGWSWLSRTTAWFVWELSSSYSQGHGKQGNPHSSKMKGPPCEFENHISSLKKNKHIVWQISPLKGIQKIHYTQINTSAEINNS